MASASSTRKDALRPGAAPPSTAFAPEDTVMITAPISPWSSTSLSRRPPACLGMLPIEIKILIVDLVDQMDEEASEDPDWTGPLPLCAFRVNREFEELIVPRIYEHVNFEGTDSLKWIKRYVKWIAPLRGHHTRSLQLVFEDDLPPEPDFEQRTELYARIIRLHQNVDDLDLGIAPATTSLRQQPLDLLCRSSIYPNLVALSLTGFDNALLDGKKVFAILQQLPLLESVGLHYLDDECARDIANVLANLTELGELSLNASSDHCPFAVQGKLWAADLNLYIRDWSAHDNYSTATNELCDVIPSFLRSCQSTLQVLELGAWVQDDTSPPDEPFDLPRLVDLTLSAEEFDWTTSFPTSPLVVITIGHSGFRFDLDAVTTILELVEAHQDTLKSLIVGEDTIPVDSEYWDPLRRKCEELDVTLEIEFQGASAEEEEGSDEE